MRGGDARRRLENERDETLSSSAVLWLTGLSGAGKSTVANLLCQNLRARGREPLLLDGDQLRLGVCSDLGFSEQDRHENLRRAAQLAALAHRQGILVIGALISPFQADRRFARSLIPEGQFFEVHIYCPLAVCRKRDPKGLYAKANRGEISNFTGLDSPYEPPENPELRIDSSRTPPQQSVEQLLSLLTKNGIV